MKTIEQMRAELMAHAMVVEELRLKMQRLDADYTTTRDKYYQAEADGRH